MAKKQSRAVDVDKESDSAFFLKIVLYVAFGAMWLRFASPLQLGPLSFSGFPLGLVIGLLFASHDHFRIDRKIEYAILVIMTIFGFFLPTAILL